MSKKIATLPDFLGDDWDPFVKAMAQEIMDLEADRTKDKFQINLRSLMLKNPAYLIYKANSSDVQVVFWVEINDKAKIPISSIAALIKQGWKEGPQLNGYVSFARNFKKTDVNTSIPRSLVTVLKMLKVIPFPKQ